MTGAQPTTPADTVIEVENLRKTFPRRGTGSSGDTIAVDDVSFAVGRRRALAIVGESGSGKTTVARMLVGLERPTAGKITIAGHDRTEASRRSAERKRRARDIQIVFQDPYRSLDPRQTARACLDEVLRLHTRASSSERAERVSALGELVGLDDRQLRALPRALSGGQRQRVAIARALAVEPAVLVLDEAVAALDVSIQAQILNLLADIRDETGVTCIFISHDLAVVRQVTEEMVVMRHGKVVEHGPTGALLDDPQHPYTRLLRDSVPGPGWKPKRTRIPAPVAPAGAGPA
jgi:ABC-type glutathione transport system ATPase component